MGLEVLLKAIVEPQAAEHGIYRVRVHPLAAGKPGEEQRLCAASFEEPGPDVVHVIAQVFERLRTDRHHTLTAAFALHADRGAFLVDIVDVERGQLAAAKPAGVGKVDYGKVPLLPEAMRTPQAAVYLLERDPAWYRARKPL